MKAAQKDVVDRHRRNIIEVLKTYSDTAIIWLCNQGYLSESAEDQNSSTKTRLARATHTLECLFAADNGWLGLIKFLKHHSNRNLACILRSELKSKRSRIPKHADNLHFTQVESSHCVPSTVSSVTPEWLASLQDQLTWFYKGDFSHVELFSNDSASAVPLKKIWVNLAMEMYITKEIHDNYLQTLNEAFKSSLPIIVKGEPGAGKSTLVHKICCDWTRGKLPQFDLVICGKMREVTQADTVLDIALNWTTSRCDGINFDSLKEKMKCNSTQNLDKPELLIILDGFDESVCQCNELERLKSKQPFRLPFTLVVTTRPYKLYEIACKHQLLTLCGFSLSQQLKFLKNVCKLQRKAPILLQEKIKNTAGLRALCRIPLFIYFLCSLENVEALDGSVTNLLFSLCDSFISRYQMSTNTSAELTDWRESKWIASLGSLAFYGLKDFVDGKLCFDNADLEMFSIDSNNIAYSVGFLNKEEIVSPTGRSRRVSVSFPHKVFQEFFAALALSNNSSTLRDFFQMLEGESHKRLEMQQVLIFLAGMDGNRASLFAFLRSKIATFGPSVEDGLALLEQIKIECGDQGQAHDLLRESICIYYLPRFYLYSISNWHSTVNVYNTYLRAADAATIPCNPEGSSQLLFWNRHYTRCEAHNVNTLDKQTLVDHLKNNLDEMLHVWFSVAEQHLADVIDILQMSQLPLELLRVAADRGGEDNRIAWPAMPTLHVVVIESTHGGRTGLVPQAVQLLLAAQPAIQWLVFRGAENQRVTSLDCHCWPNTTTMLIFHKVNLDAVLISQLCQSLDKLHITGLFIYKASVQLEALACLCHALSKQRHLELLTLVSIRMDGLQSPAGCHTFEECCRGLTFLRELVLCDCGITDTVAECLLASFQAMKDLKKINLRFNPLSEVMKIKLRQCFNASCFMLHASSFVNIITVPMGRHEVRNVIVRLS